MAFPPGQFTVGRDAIRTLWAKFLADAPHFEPEQPLPTLISGDLALTSTPPTRRCRRPCPSSPPAGGWPVAPGAGSAGVPPSIISGSTDSQPHRHRPGAIRSGPGHRHARGRNGPRRRDDRCPVRPAHPIDRMPASDGPVAVTVTLHADHIDVAHPPVGEDCAALKSARRSRRWLDLEIDHSLVRDALGGDPVIGALVSARPGLRVIGYPDGFEAAVLVILGQHVSVGAARTFSGRLVAAFGSAGPAGLLNFPPPQRLATPHPPNCNRRSESPMPGPGRCSRWPPRVRIGLVIDPAGDHLAIRRELLALPGIGPWTVETVAARALATATPTRQEISSCNGHWASAPPRLPSEPRHDWAPYRAYGLFHLWSAALGI